jgi:hypothetical protein
MPVFRSISHVLAAIFSNASDFNRRWNEPTTPAQMDIPARWEGKWISETNGHNGALRCILNPTTTTEYEASFYAVYAGFLRVCYTVSLHGQRSGQTLSLDGDADLGKLAGGNYHYAGEATPQAFRCTYECKYDCGTFEMSPAANPPRQY